MFSRSAPFAVLAFFGASGLAIASSSKVNTSFGPATALKDDSTGLIWLDLTISKDQSFDYVTANLAPGGIYNGWRFATPAELSQFFTDYDGGVVNDTLALAFMNDLGGPVYTAYNPQNGFRRQSSQGLLDIPFDLGHGIYGYIAVDNFDGPSIDPSLQGSSVDYAGASDVGSWLVRVPPPFFPALSFIPIAPCRAVDTRNAAGPLGGPSIAAGTSRDFAIVDNACGIPANAAALSLNATVVPHGGLGYLTVWPSGQARPFASTLNSLDGRPKANALIALAGANGAISVFATDDTDVILDINGYFVPAFDNNPNALWFYPLTPCRIADTRASDAPSLSAGASRSFAIAGICGVPAVAEAYSLNFTAIPNWPLGYLTVWPTGQQKPVVSTLNALTGAITANAAIVPAGTNGSIDVYTTSDADLAIDVNGYFAPPGAGGLLLYSMGPCRVLDTRSPAGSPPPAVQMDVNVTASDCGAPVSAQAWVVNATVVPPAALGYLSLWPQGEARPLVSTLNALDGTITSNMAIVPTTNGSISAFPSSATHLVLDLFGYFAP